MYTKSTVSDIPQRVRTALSESRYGAVRNLQCDYRDGTVWLRGTVPNYFLKQVGQELVLDCIDRETSVVNRVQVKTD